MAAVLSRNPLGTVKPLANHVSATVSPWNTTARRLSSTSKRAHSPDPTDGLGQSAKRARPVPESSRAAARDELKRRDARESRESKEERDKRRLEREEEFRVKYTRAFPNWTFHFDLDTHQPEVAVIKNKLERRVAQLGAKVDDFFSKEVTHLITLESEEAPGNKENTRNRNHAGGSLLGSPIRIKSRTPAETRGSELVKKAIEFDIKVWSVEKLSSVLDRCQPPSTANVPTSAPIPLQFPTDKRQLTKLLESERLHGTTERDPSQRRHDYIYFNKGSYFLLIEDMRQELATIAALEYPVQRTRDGKERGSWPILYCHPRARGPFLEYNEREERRREKADEADKEREEELAQRKAQIREEERRRRAKLQAQVQAAQHKDLRRAMSMQNLRRQFSTTGGDDAADGDGDLGEGEAAESAAASGYLASGAYVAASGNSVSITSAAATTSTAGMSFRTMRLPPSLRDKIDNQVITSRRLPTASIRPGKENAMGPPLAIPDHPQRTLRKSKSTTTMRLAKRDEGMKPGYCECCRVKFEDFKQHIYSRRHRKFADDDANFANLDVVLDRVRRRTVDEVQEELGAWEYSISHLDEPQDEANAGDADVDFELIDRPDYDEGYAGGEYSPVPPDQAEDGFKWHEWVEDEV